MKDVDPEHRQTVRFYDAEAGHYDARRYASAAGARIEAFHVRVLQAGLFTGLSQGSRVLELGCGTGRLLNRFRRSHPGVQGLDASPGMLQMARRAELQVPLVLGTAYGLPYRDASFDAVYSVLVLNLLVRYRDAIREVARVLKPGGQFMFNVPHLGSVYWPAGLWVNLRGKTVGRNETGHRHSHWFTLGEITAAVEEAGLRCLRVYGQPPLLSRGWWSAPLPGTALGRLLSKSLYIVAQKDG